MTARRPLAPIADALARASSFDPAVHSTTGPRQRERQQSLVNPSAECAIDCLIPASALPESDKKLHHTLGPVSRPRSGVSTRYTEWNACGMPHAPTLARGKSSSAYASMPESLLVEGTLDRSLSRPARSISQCTVLMRYGLDYWRPSPRCLAALGEDGSFPEILRVECSSLVRNVLVAYTPPLPMYSRVK